jgi:hypothetical protein
MNKEAIELKVKVLVNDLNQVKAQMYELSILEKKYEGAIESMQILLKEQDNEDKHI